MSILTKPKEGPGRRSSFHPISYTMLEDLLRLLSQSEASKLSYSTARKQVGLVFLYYTGMQVSMLKRIKVELIILLLQNGLINK